MEYGIWNTVLGQKSGCIYRIGGIRIKWNVGIGSGMEWWIWLPWTNLSVDSAVKTVMEIRGINIIVKNNQD